VSSGKHGYPLPCTVVTSRNPPGGRRLYAGVPYPISEEGGQKPLSPQRTTPPRGWSGRPRRPLDEAPVHREDRPRRCSPASPRQERRRSPQSSAGQTAQWSCSPLGTALSCTSPLAGVSVHPLDQIHADPRATSARLAADKASIWPACGIVIERPLKGKPGMRTRRCKMMDPFDFRDHLPGDDLETERCRRCDSTAAGDHLAGLRSVWRTPA